MGLVLLDLTDEQKKELDLKGRRADRGHSGRVRGNVQQGDVIIAVISKGVTTPANSAAQVNDLLAKMEKNASVTLQLRRGEQQFFATIRLPNGQTE